MGADHGFTHEFFVGRIDGLIESHVNIGTNFPLGLHGNFRIHADFIAVDVRFEGDAVVVDFGIREGEHLKAARIGESWAMPASKFGKSAGFFDKIWAWSENKMIGVGENALRAKLAHLGVSDSFNGGAGGGADKSRRLDVAMWRVDDTGAHEAGLFDNIEFQHCFYSSTREGDLTDVSIND